MYHYIIQYKANIKITSGILYIGSGKRERESERVEWTRYVIIMKSSSSM